MQFQIRIGTCEFFGRTEGTGPDMSIHVDAFTSSCSEAEIDSVDCVTCELMERLIADFEGKNSPELE